MAFSKIGKIFSKAMKLTEDDEAMEVEEVPDTTDVKAEVKVAGMN